MPKPGGHPWRFSPLVLLVNPSPNRVDFNFSRFLKTVPFPLLSTSATFNSPGSVAWPGVMTSAQISLLPSRWFLFHDQSYCLKDKFDQLMSVLKTEYLDRFQFLIGYKSQIFSTDSKPPHDLSSSPPCSFFLPRSSPWSPSFNFAGLISIPRRHQIPSSIRVFAHTLLIGRKVPSPLPHRHSLPLSGYFLALVAAYSIWIEGKNEKVGDMKNEHSPVLHLRSSHLDTPVQSHLT